MVLIRFTQDVCAHSNSRSVEAPFLKINLQMWEIFTIEHCVEVLQTKLSHIVQLLVDCILTMTCSQTRSSFHFNLSVVILELPSMAIILSTKGLTIILSIHLGHGGVVHLFGVTQFFSNYRSIYWRLMTFRCNLTNHGKPSLARLPWMKILSFMLLDSK